jgi:hypothetical protein
MSQPDTLNSDCVVVPVAKGSSVGLGLTSGGVRVAEEIDWVGWIEAIITFVGGWIEVSGVTMAGFPIGESTSKSSGDKHPEKAMHHNIKFMTKNIFVFPGFNIFASGTYSLCAIVVIT